MKLALLDTDILNEVLKRKNANVLHHAAAYLQHHQQFAFSALTWYEEMRGLRDKAASRQLGLFESFCRHSAVFDVSTAILDRTADLWVDARRQGLARTTRTSSSRPRL